MSMYQQDEFAKNEGNIYRIFSQMKREVNNYQRAA
jgi:hypothetical protein